MRTTALCLILLLAPAAGADVSVLGAQTPLPASPSPSAPARGPQSAPVTIVEFADFECPYCARVAETLQTVQREYGNQVRLVFVHYPLPFHKNAELAAEATLAAHAQGRFWAMHDAIFEAMRLRYSETPRFEPNAQALEGLAAKIGLDMARYRKDMAEHRHAAAVRADKELTQRLGVTGTPHFYINGKKLAGAQPIGLFRTAIDEELARTRMSLP